jgi:hypothetical protein
MREYLEQERAELLVHRELLALVKKMDQQQVGVRDTALDDC